MEQELNMGKAEKQEAFTGMNTPETETEAAQAAAGQAKEVDAVAPTSCQPGKAVDVWNEEEAGYIPADALAEHITDGATLFGSPAFGARLQALDGAEVYLTRQGEVVIRCGDAGLEIGYA